MKDSVIPAMPSKESRRYMMLYQIETLEAYKSDLVSGYDSKSEFGLDMYCNADYGMTAILGTVPELVSVSAEYGFQGGYPTVWFDCIGYFYDCDLEKWCFANCYFSLRDCWSLDGTEESKENIRNNSNIRRFHEDD